MRCSQRTLGIRPRKGSVMDEGVGSNGRVLRAAGVEQKRCRANRGIGITRVEDQRSSANTGVEAAGGDAKHRKRTKCCVPNARSESLKGVVPRRRGEVGIAPGGWRADCLRVRQKTDANQRDDKYWNCFL